ncbi:uncharacterized protein [Aristolochia californica]|uniref:uncharacterized protein isoform X1 n=1 Tax=Aristolochia californica TaxID=171875 RepID=UPI0035D8273D
MDFSSKGISWVGNMYQKLETVCVDVLQEMDNFMAQEPARSVETQVQAVSVNVQKFCDEVIKDILAPSSVHSSQVPVTELSVAYDIGFGLNQSVPNKDLVSPSELDVTSMEVKTVSPVEDSSEGSITDITQNEHHRAKCDILSNKSVSLGSEEEKCLNVSDGAAFIDNRAGSLWSDSELASIVYHGSTPTPLSSTLSSSMTGTVTSSPAISVLASPVSKASEPDAENGESGNPGENNASDAMDVEVQEKFEDLFLGESYLDVQSKEIDNELSFLSRRVAIRKSYKKKLRDALLSRLLPATKHRYRKLQILNSGVEDKDLESSSLCSKSVEFLDMKKPPSQEFCESEWEFL